MSKKIITVFLTLILFLNFTAAHSQTRTKQQAKALADDIYKQLIGGANFATLAKKHSDDPGSQPNGGKYSNVRLGDMTPEFEKVVYNMKVNGISRPFLTPYGYHV